MPAQPLSDEQLAEIRRVHTGRYQGYWNGPASPAVEFVTALLRHVRAQEREIRSLRAEVAQLRAGWKMEWDEMPSEYVERVR